MDENSSKRKHQPTRVDPNNAEAVRLEQARQRKKQRLANKANNPAKVPNASKSVKQKEVNRSVSVEDVEDEDIVKATHRPKAKNPRNILESSEDDDEVVILDHPSKSQRKTPASDNSESESESSEGSDNVPEKPEESATAELSEIHP
jgi:hypothetical protein